jgi:hypothetical protein
MLSLIYFSENFRVSKNFLKSGESWSEFREFSWDDMVSMGLCRDMKLISIF